MTNDMNDQLKGLLDTLNQIASNPEQGQSIFLHNVLTPEFIAANTEFKTADAFFQSGGIDFSSPEAFEAVPEDQLDAFIGKTTSFENWQMFLNAASEKWADQSIARIKK